MISFVLSPPVRVSVPRFGDRPRITVTAAASIGSHAVGRAGRGGGHCRSITVLMSLGGDRDISGDISRRYCHLARGFAVSVLRGRKCCSADLDGYAVGQNVAACSRQRSRPCGFIGRCSRAEAGRCGDVCAAECSIVFL